MLVCPLCGSLFTNGETRCRHDDAALTPVDDPLIGRVVGGRFSLMHRLGAGGSSSVYLAKHVVIKRLVAVKILDANSVLKHTVRERFIREARAVNRINHENIVEITDFGESDELTYLVMEYVPGTSLFQKMFDPLPVERALHIVEQVARALARAHDLNVIHRDLKPQNILIVERKNAPDLVKLVDFGLAKILDGPEYTKTQQILGTPGYIAPEHIKLTLGDGQLDGRADLYALGVVLYELLTAEVPYASDQSDWDLLVAHAEHEPALPSTHVALPLELERFVLRCLEKRPADRFRDAHHFLEELRKVRHEIGIPEPADSPEATQLDLVRPASLAEIPSPPDDDGSMGASQWRARFEAIREAIEDVPPAAIASSMNDSETQLCAFEELAAIAREQQRELEAKVEEGRELRSTLGRAIEMCSRAASTFGGEVEDLARTRDDRRARLRQVANSPDAEALEWQVAALDAQLGTTRVKRDLERARMQELRRELDERNEQLQKGVRALVEKSSVQLRALSEIAERLKASLAVAEAHVHAS